MKTISYKEERYEVSPITLFVVLPDHCKRYTTVNVDIKVKAHRDNVEDVRLNVAVPLVRVIRERIQYG